MCVEEVCTGSAGFSDAPSRRRPAVDNDSGLFSVLRCVASKVMNIEFVNIGEVN